MSVDAPKPIAIPQIDYADHTLEVDTRFLFTDRPDFKAQMEKAYSSGVSDLDETQVNELLTQDKPPL